jgi:putative flippase GtrA
MGARLRRITGEAARFSAVNVVATAVAIVLFNLLVHGVPGLATPGPLNGWPVTSWFLANCVGMVISFYGSSRFAFRHRQASGPGGGAVRYVAVNLASFLIPMACLWISRNVLGWDSALADNVTANVVGAFLGMLFRFWAFRTFVFTRRPSAFSVPAPARGLSLPDQRRAGSAGLPEVGPDEPELVEHQPKQRQADPDHVVRVARHPRHEGPTEPVECEGPSYG